MRSPRPATASPSPSSTSSSAVKASSSGSRRAACRRSASHRCRARRIRSSHSTPVASRSRSSTVTDGLGLSLASSSMRSPPVGSNASAQARSWARRTVADGGRVIAGAARGTRLETPPEATRPLTDRVKESLFAALESSGALDGPFLDLFAGSGAAGIEALSRGAPTATFVERDGKTCAVIGANLRRTRLDAAADVVRADAASYLAAERGDSGSSFTAALVDPPYGDTILERVLDLLGDERRGWLSEGATVVAKHFWRDEMPEQVGDLTRSRQKRFGETMLSFYTRGR